MLITDLLKQPILLIILICCFVGAVIAKVKNQDKTFIVFLSGILLVIALLINILYFAPLIQNITDVLERHQDSVTVNVYGNVYGNVTASSSTPAPTFNPDKSEASTPTSTPAETSTTTTTFANEELAVDDSDVSLSTLLVKSFFITFALMFLLFVICIVLEIISEITGL